jgi:hypothetical protein
VKIADTTTENSTTCFHYQQKNTKQRVIHRGSRSRNERFATAMKIEHTAIEFNTSFILNTNSVEIVPQSAGVKARVILQDLVTLYPRETATQNSHNP